MWEVLNSNLVARWDMPIYSTLVYMIFTRVKAVLYFFARRGLRVWGPYLVVLRAPRAVLGIKL